MRFILLAEGATEKIAVAGFLKRWLDSQLKTTKVRVDPVPLFGWANFKKEVVKRARGLIRAPSGDSRCRWRDQQPEIADVRAKSDRSSHQPANWDGRVEP